MISFATSLLAGSVAPAAADTVAPPAMVAQVRSAIASAWSVSEERIRLAFGRMPPMTIADSGKVRIAGQGTDGWYVAVLEGTSPVAVRVRAGVEDTVPVAAQPLLPGRVLDSADVKHAVATHWGFPGHAGIAPGAGWVVKRPLAAGEVLRQPAVMPPLAIRAGQPVRISWQRGAVAVVLDAVSLNDAPIGGRVNARTTTGMRLSGKVVGPGEASLERGIE